MQDQRRTKAQLLAELESLRCASAAGERRAARLARAEQRLRDAIWRMRHSDDLAGVLEALRIGLEELELDFLDCGVNVVATDSAVTIATVNSVSRSGNWTRPDTEFGAANIIRFWQGGKSAYRPDLLQEDRYDERAGIERNFGHPVRCVVDVPFTHGTLAVNSQRPHAFSEQDLADLRHLAAVLGEAYQRREDFLLLEDRTRALEAEIAGRTLAETELVQAQADLRQALEREQVMGRLRDRILGLNDLSDFSAALEQGWVADLRGLGIPVYKVSLQEESRTAASYRLHWKLLPSAGEHGDQDQDRLHYPWVRQAWDEGRTVVVDEAQLQACRFWDPEIRSIAEVPLPGGGSLGVSSKVAGAFDAAAVNALEVFAGLLATALERWRSLEALHRVNAALAQAQHVSRVGSWVWHIQSDRLEWSDEMHRIFGIDPDGFTGSLSEVIARAIHPDDRAAVEQANLLVARDGVPVPLEYRVVWPDGSVHTIWGQAGELQVDDEGRPTLLTGIVQEITERKQVEHTTQIRLAIQQVRNKVLRLEREEDWADIVTAVDEELSRLVRYDGVGVNLVDLEHHRFTGWSVEEGFPREGRQCGFVPGSLVEAMTSERPLYRRNREEMTAYGDSIGPERQSVIDAPFPGGTIAISANHPDAFTPSDVETLAGFAAVVGEARLRIRDLTEARRLEQSLRDERELIRRVMETSPVGITVVNGQGRLIFANRAAEAIHGVTRDELLTRQFNDPQWRITDFHDRPFPEDRLPFNQVMATGQPVFNVEHAVVRPDGRRTLLSINAAPLISVTGKVEGMVASLQDVTDQKRLELEMEDQRLRAAQVDRLQALGEMATGIAHELNQPLNGIRTFAEGTLLGLRQEWRLSAEELAATLQDIIAQVDRMSGIIDHMRVFARDQSAQEAEPFNLAEVITGALKLMGAQLRVHGITVRQELPADLPECRGWPNAIEQVVLNLLSNARDALDERLQRQKAGGTDSVPGWHPELTLRAVVSGTSVRLEVQDNGGGIPPAAVDRIFDPFFTTKEVGKGTGIGLAIARGIVDRHGGRISVDNRSGQGVTFVIALPVAVSPSGR